MQTDLRLRIKLPMIHCIIITPTVNGKSFNEERHQVIIVFTISSDSLYFGIRHFINDTRLIAPKYKFKI